MRRAAELIARGVCWLSGFGETHARQSMARLCAFIFAVSGAVIGMAGAALAIIAVRGPRPDLAPVAELVRALAVLASAFVTSGAVALLLRQRAARAADSSQPSTPNV